MSHPRAALAVALSLACALSASIWPLPAQAAPDVRDRFEVLQAAYFAFGAGAPTHQGLADRCVLFEQNLAAGGETSAVAAAAAERIVNSTARAALAYARFADPNARFGGYYKATIVPTAVFDGLAFEFGGNSQTADHYNASLEQARGRGADASINVSGAIVIDNGYVDYEVFSPLNLTGFAVTLRVEVVEDPVATPMGGPDQRFVVRQYLSGVPLALAGNTSASGRLNFEVDPAWVESRLAAIAFVQVDAPPAVPRPAPAPPFDVFAAVVVPLAVLLTGTAMAALVARYIRAERRARVR